MARESFPRAYRIRRGEEFAEVYAQRCRASDDVLLIYARRNALGHPRLGLSVPRKVGDAVERNRWKRLLREAFRRSIDQLPGSLDLVISPRPGAIPSLATIEPSLKKLSSRLLRRLEETK